MENNQNTNKKMINPSALANLTKNSEVTESKENQNDNDVIVRKKEKRLTKVFLYLLSLRTIMNL